MNTAHTPQDTTEPDVSTASAHETHDHGTGYDPFGRKRSLHRTEGPLGGVAGGLAEYMNIDPTAARVLFVIAGLATGPGALLAYGAAWAVMPGEDGSESPVDRIIRSDARIGGTAS